MEGIGDLAVNIGNQSEGEFLVLLELLLGLRCVTNLPLGSEAHCR